MTPLSLQSLRRIAVVRPLPGLGDFLCAVPALRALRAALPDTEVVLVALPQARAIVSRFPQYVDRTLELPGWPGLPDSELQIERVPDFLSAAIAERFDLAVQMHGTGLVSNHLTALLGARASVGYYVSGNWCPDEDWYLPWTGRQPEPRRWLDLVAHIGIPARGSYLEFPVSDRERREFEVIAHVNGLTPGAYICVHPGAGPGRRRWPPDRFAQVADALAARGLRVVLTGAPDDAEATAAVRRAMRADSVDLTGRTDLGQLGALLESSALLLCNDTGVSHIAAALGVPSVIVFTASDPARWAPSNRRLHRVVLEAPWGQRVGAWKGCVDSAEAAIAEAEDLLDKRPLNVEDPAATLAAQGWS